MIVAIEEDYREIGVMRAFSSDVFRNLARNAEEALSVIARIRWGNETANYKEAFSEYYEVVCKLTKECRAEAAAAGAWR